MIHKTDDTKMIIIQVVLTLAIAFLPLYFYLQASFENQKIKDKMMLKNYENSVISKMQNFEQENSDIFYYPRSNIFTSAIFDHNDKTLFSLFQAHQKFDTENDFFTHKKQICHKEYLSKNLFNAHSIVVCKDIDNSQVIYNTIILMLTMSFFIFLSSFFTIKQSIEPYKKLYTILDDFLKDAMHELRTPLGVARINVDLLQMKIYDNKNLLRIKSALKNMTIIYEDLEYYIQRFNTKDDKKILNFSGLLEKRIDFFSDLTTAKNITLKKNISLDIVLYFNEIELYRIIDNNISNAIKYSKENTTITISLYKDEKYISLIFQDQGIGIKDTRNIFERYFRGDKITGGFGIGLNIVKNICEKNDIKITVQSELQKGSTFSYKIQNNIHNFT